MMRRPTTNEMPFLDHLEELRWRIVWAAIALGIGFAIGLALVFSYQAVDVIGWIAAPMQPYLPAGQHLKTFGLMEALQIRLSAGLWIGAVLASPAVLYQAWAFLSPALHAHERRALVSTFAAGVLLFFIGVTFAFRVVLPASIPVLIGINGAFMDNLLGAKDYFDFVFTLTLGFGAAFELPVVVVLLSASGFVTPRLLATHRRHAVVGILVLSAILSPGSDALVMMMMAGPLYVLFEISILASYLVHRRRDQADAVLMLLFAPMAFLTARRRRAAA
jgi:sec-independent protein translocase protein TatC